MEGLGSGNHIRLTRNSATARRMSPDTAETAKPIDPARPTAASTIHASSTAPGDTPSSLTESASTEFERSCNTVAHSQRTPDRKQVMIRWIIKGRFRWGRLEEYSAADPTEHMPGGILVLHRPGLPGLRASKAF